MNEKVLKFLYDIKLALDEIDSFIASKNKYFTDSASDLLLKRAIERNLEIIGEAMSRILKEDPLFQLENSRKIIGLRNQIIHGYDSISDENIWGIIINHLPNLNRKSKN
ncbi:MAG: DUF86 domain-containing protein [Mariniphaga sp.]